MAKLGTPMAIKSAAISFSKIFVNSFGTAVSAFAGVANKPYLFGVILDGGYYGFFLGDALAGLIGTVFYISGKWRSEIK